MALEAVVFPQDPLISTPSFNCNYPNSNVTNNNNSSNTIGMSYDFASYYSYTSKLEDTLKSPYNVELFEANNNNNNSNQNNHHISNNFCEFSPTSELLNLDENNDNNNVPQWSHHQYQYMPSNYSSPEDNSYPSSEAPPPSATTSPIVGAGAARRKRRRRSCKNKEEVEHQRMTHIAVERNRRKQMNEYLAVIRSLMPPSYVQRGDQASIVGGAINYVKELEQLLQSIEGQNRSNTHSHHDHHHENSPPSSKGDGSDESSGADESNSSSKTQAWPLLFADFFSFPQYSTRSKPNSQGLGGSNSISSSNSGVGEIEVTMVESHANVKILAKKHSKQLVKLIAGFQGLRLNVLHLNVTTVDSFVLYSLSLKVEEGCQLNSVDDIAAATNHILGQIQDEAEDHIVS